MAWHLNRTRDDLGSLVCDWSNRLNLCKFLIYGSVRDNSLVDSATLSGDELVQGNRASLEAWGARFDARCDQAFFHSASLLLQRASAEGETRMALFSARC